MSILIFFLVLFILVLVHEWGHFIVAKKTGMRVDEFGIGFPPKLFGIKKGETEYSFNALPIGGFVKIFGENGEEPFSPVESEASDRRSETLVEAGEGGTKSKDHGRSFSSRPRWAQAMVLIAGVTMNVLFAWFLFSVTYMIGIPTQVEESVATDSAELVIAGTIADSPAESIPVGATVNSLEANGRVIESPMTSDFINLVSELADTPITVEYTQGDTKETVELTPVQGLIEDDTDRYGVGVSLMMVDEVSKPFLTAIIDGFIATVDGLKAITVGLYTLIAQSFTGEADYSQVAGPVGIVSMVGDAASFGIATLLTFTAIISLNLAIINLLPFPALDGGRLVFVAIESVTKKPIPPEWAGRINLVGFAILMLLMIVVTYNDILRLL